MSGPTLSPSRVDTHRFRPDMMQLETREAPAAITLADFYVVRAGSTLTQTRPNRFGVAGVLRNDYDSTQGTPPPFRNFGMTAALNTRPLDAATGIPVTTPFTFASNGAFTFRAPRNFNGVIRFTYVASAADGSASVVTPVIISVFGPIRRVAVAADSGSAPAVTVYDATTTNQLFSFFAFDQGFRGGVRVATGDFTGDGTDDIVTAAGAAAGGHVKIFDGRTGAEYASFFAFEGGYEGGVNVSAGDFNSDNVDDLVVSAGSGPDAHVKVFDGTKVSAASGFDPASSSSQLASFFAYGKGEVSGVRTTVGDIDGDGNSKLLTAPAKGSTLVKAFDLSSGNAVQTKAFSAGDPADNRGLFLAAGDFNGDFFDDLVVGSGSGVPEARIYAGISGAGSSMRFERTLDAATFGDNFAADAVTNPFLTNPQPGYLTGALASPAQSPTGFVGSAVSTRPGDFGGVTGGMRVGVDYANLDNFADVILGGGPGGFSRFQIISGKDVSLLSDLTVYPGFFGGISVAGHH